MVGILNGVWTVRQARQESAAGGAVSASTSTLNSCDFCCRIARATNSCCQGALAYRHRSKLARMRGACPFKHSAQTVQRASPDPLPSRAAPDTPLIKKCAVLFVAKQHAVSKPSLLCASHEWSPFCFFRGARPLGVVPARNARGGGWMQVWGLVCCRSHEWALLSSGKGGFLACRGQPLKVPSQKSSFRYFLYYHLSSSRDEPGAGRADQLQGTVPAAANLNLPAEKERTPTKGFRDCSSSY